MRLGVADRCMAGMHQISARMPRGTVRRLPAPRDLAGRCSDWGVLRLVCAGWFDDRRKFTPKGLQLLRIATVALFSILFFAPFSVGRSDASPPAHLKAAAEPASLSGAISVANSVDLGVRQLVQQDDPTWLAWSPNGKLLAALSRVYTHVTIWDVERRRIVREISLHRLGDASLGFLSDRYILTPADSNENDQAAAVTVWDLETGALVRNVDGPYPPGSPQYNLTRPFALSSDKSRLAIAAEHDLECEVVVYETHQWTVIARLGARVGTPMALAFSPRGDRLAVGTAGGTVALFDVQHQALQWTQEAYAGSYASVAALAFSPDGRYVASGPTAQSDKHHGPDGQLHDVSRLTDAIRLWADADGTLVRSFQGAPDQVASLSWSKSGRHLASANYRGDVKLWASETGSPETVMTFAGAAMSVAFSPDGKWLAAASGNAIALKKLDDR
jgi:WD40 repeat protein